MGTKRRYCGLLDSLGCLSTCTRKAAVYRQNNCHHGRKGSPKRFHSRRRSHCCSHEETRTTLWWETIRTPCTRAARLQLYQKSAWAPPRPAYRQKHVSEVRDPKPEAARMERRLVQVVKSITSPSETVMDWAAVINKFEHLLSSSDNANPKIESTSEYTVVRKLEASGIEQSVDSESSVANKMRGLDISNDEGQPSNEQPKQ